MLAPLLDPSPDEPNRQPPGCGHWFVRWLACCVCPEGYERKLK